MDYALDILALCYDSVEKIKDDRYVVYQNGECAIVDSNNNIIVDFGNQTITKAYDDFIVQTKKGFAFLDKETLKVKTDWLQELQPIAGLYKFRRLIGNSNGYGLMNRNKEEIAPAIYWNISLVDRARLKLEVINYKDGMSRFVANITSDGLSIDKLDLITTSDPYINFVGVRYIDRTRSFKYRLQVGNTLVGKEYDSFLYPTWYHKYGLFDVKNGGYAGLINIKGEELIAPDRYDYISYTGVGSICIVGVQKNRRDMLYGLRLMQGDEIFECIYSRIEVISGLYYILLDDGKNQFVLGNDGKIHSSLVSAFPIYRLSDSYSQGREIYKINIYNNWIAIDRNLNRLDFDMSKFEENCWVRVK